MSSYVAVASPAFNSVEDFLAWVDPQPERWELVDGSAVSLAAGTARKQDLQISLLTALRVRSRRKTWRPHGPDLLIRIDHRTGRFPDASITGGPRATDQAADPLVIFEILSDAEMERTGSQRLLEFQGLSTLQSYVVIARDRVHVTSHFRRPGGWRAEVHREPTAALELHSIKIELPLAELYAGMEID